MARSKEQNLRIVITGETSDIENKFIGVRTAAKDMGLAVTKEMFNIAKGGKSASAQITVMGEALQDFERQLQEIASTSFTTDFEATADRLKKEQEKAAKEAEKIEKEKQRKLLQIRKEAERKENARVKSRLKSFKDVAARQVELAKRTADSEASAAVIGGEKRVTLKKKNIEKLLKLEQNFQKELEALATKFSKTKTEGRKIASQRTQLIKRYREETAEIKKQLLVIDEAAKKERETIRLRKESLRKSKEIQKERLRSFKTTAEEEVRIAKASIDAEANAAVLGSENRIAIKKRNAVKLLQIEQKFQKDLQTLATKFSKTRISDKGFASQRQALVNSYRKATIEIKKQNLALDETAKKISAASFRHKNWLIRLSEIVGAYKIINGLINTVTRAIRSIPDIGIQLQTTQAVFEATLNSGAETAAVFKFLDQEAERTGIAITTLRENFRNLNASMSLAGESLDTVIDIFSNFNTVSTAMHLSADKTQAIFLAVAQIFNKTKVQSEELVKQLGNLLPGAFAAFRKANEDTFKTTQDLVKAMQNGTVLAHKTMANFARFLGEEFAPGFRLAADGIQANIGRMQTAFIHLGEAIFNDANEPFTELIKVITDLTNSLTDLIKNTEGFKDVLGGLLAAAAGFSIAKISKSIFNVVDGFKKAKKEGKGFKKFLDEGFPASTVFGIIATELFLIAEAWEKAGKLGEEAIKRVREQQALLNGELKDKKRDPFIASISEAKNVKDAFDELTRLKNALIDVKDLVDNANLVTDPQAFFLTVGRKVKMLKRVQEIEKAIIIAQENLDKQILKEIAAKKLAASVTDDRLRTQKATELEAEKIKILAEGTKRWAQVHNESSLSIKSDLVEIEQAYNDGLLTVEDFYARKRELIQQDLQNQISIKQLELAVLRENKNANQQKINDLDLELKKLQAKKEVFLQQSSAEEKRAAKKTEIEQARLFAKLRGDTEDFQRVQLLELEKAHEEQLKATKGNADLRALVEENYQKEVLKILDQRPKNEEVTLASVTEITRNAAQERVQIEEQTANKIIDLQERIIQSKIQAAEAFAKVGNTLQEKKKFKPFEQSGLEDIQSAVEAVDRARGTDSESDAQRALIEKVAEFTKDFGYNPLRGFATGGSFTVGGNGGVDSTLVAFRATKGEKVSIQTPQQQQTGTSIVIQNVNLPNVSNATEFVEELKQMLRVDPTALQTVGARAG